MDFNAPMNEQAATLLRHIIEVGDWALSGDPRAKPYLDADAVRIEDGVPHFNEKRFIDVYTYELFTKEHN